MHYLMMISENESMMYQAEMLVRSIRRFSQGKPVEFTLIIQGYDRGPVRLPLPMAKIDKQTNQYLQNHVEILYTPYYWELGAPCRWFVEPRRPMCVFIDVDVVACSDLSQMYKLDEDTIHGVRAMKQHFSVKEWNSAGLDEEDRKYYFNMGMVVMPSKYMKAIGNELFLRYPKIQEQFPENKYYAGQITLTQIVKQMKLKRMSLPRKFNWFDQIPYQEMIERPLFLHYFVNRNISPNKKMMFREVEDSQYQKMIEATILSLM